MGNQKVPLMECWDWIDRHRSQIAVALEQLRPDLPRKDQKFLNRVKDWFSGTADFENAIERPDVLAICLPLAQHSSPEDTSSTIAHSTRVGFCAIGHALSMRGRLKTLWIYLALLLSGIFILAVFFSVYVIPGFENIFNEIHIKPSRLTQLVFTAAWLIRIGWIYVVLLFLGGLGFDLARNLFGNQTRGTQKSWLNQRLKTRRNEAAFWAWHVAMLLEAGLCIADAVKIAGDSQNSPWLKRASQIWLRGSAKTPSVPSKKAMPLFGHRYRLLDSTLNLSNPLAQIDLFREISTYYWERNQSIGDWWIKWAISFCYWLFVLGVIFVAFALYLPVLAMIGGISGM